jgi:CBS domain-containing protein
VPARSRAPREGHPGAGPGIVAPMTGHPSVRDHMSPARHTVRESDPITTARELMQLHAIRHLPVLDEDGAVVGMLTLGDLYVVEAVAELDPDRTTVSSAMSRDVFTVGPDAPLAEVASTMAAEHIGSALILEEGRLLGVFTATDACRVLGEVLRRSGPSQ